ncbi:Undecaprenyl phosphate N,N'-diacetylbacillosamine 1-phosphate transferase (plasmid) [Paracoccaceae bacterium]|nr:Undecaprenyl phosphate N,N'-diacetylbacillosamine 1-phosphate transferase [Paracoccaceae bacterium]
MSITFSSGLRGAEPVLGTPEQAPARGRERLVTVAALAGADGLAIALAALGIATVAGGVDPVAARLLVFAGAVQVGLKAAAGLYPGYGLHPEARLRKQAMAWLGAGAIASLAGLELTGSGATLLLPAWLGLLALLPLQAVGAFVVRRGLQGAGAWGIPVNLGGAPGAVDALRAYLSDRPQLGLYPTSEGETARVLIWAGPALPDAGTLAGLRQGHDEIVMMSDLPHLCLSGVHPSEHGGGIGLRLVRAHQTPLGAAFKRGVDLALTIPLALLAAPVVLIAALLVRRADPGPAFYVQPREGRDGRTIGVLKLRTMYLDAEAMLADLLARDPAARHEWETHYKLRHDPRILPGIGTFLRTSSIDELPQLLNVLRGDMSLVGPRPFPDYHLSAMPPEFRARRATVVPGLTGLWQISERSGLDLDGQMELDDFYIAGRSFWSDLSIFLRTFAAVIGRRGAF